MKIIIMALLIIFIFPGCTQSLKTAESTALISTCTDSDDGQDYLTKGRVVFRKNNAIDPVIHLDTCVKIDGKWHIKEAYCDDQGNPKEKIYNCPKGCSRSRTGGYCF